MHSCTKLHCWLYSEKESREWGGGGGETNRQGECGGWGGGRERREEEGEGERGSERQREMDNYRKTDMEAHGNSNEPIGNPDRQTEKGRGV